MRQERKDSIFDNFFMPLAVAGVSVVFGSLLTLFGIKKSDPAYIFHDIITYDNVSSMIETYFVDSGFVDASILALESPQEQMEMIRDIIQEQQSKSTVTTSRLNDLLLMIGYDSESMKTMNMEDIFNILSSYLTDAKEDENMLSELNAKTLADLSAPSLVVQGESINTTLRDYMAVINGKNYFQETLLNSYILDEQLSVKEGVIYYEESVPEKIRVVTDAILHDNDWFEVQKESSEYIIGSKECTYGLVNKQWGSGNSAIYIECGGQYSKIEFGLGHVNNTGGGDKTLNIYYMNANGEYELTWTEELHQDMWYEEGISVDIYNTNTVKIEYLGSYGGVRYGMTDIYLVK